jgi:iron complex transport system substrate-binding protein
MKITPLLFVLIFGMASLNQCSSRPQDNAAVQSKADEKMELDYADQFSVEYIAGGGALVTITDSGRFLVLPETGKPPANLDKDITVLKQPIENIYLAATSAMCLFDALDALGHITMSGTKADGWYVENARKAMESGSIVYAGKYSAPDYELILSRDCELAVESTMIYHTPEVMEKLEDLGVPVMVERSSYETHPLGRTEWIKLYGLLLGKDELALQIFNEQKAYLDSVPDTDTGKTAAFFYISSTGSAVTRKSGDYLAKMIKLAGGNYVFTDLGDDDSATGSVNLSMERFYAEAKDADFIIYNSSIDGELSTVKELLGKSRLLADFKAVKNGNVWCTGKNLFQETTGFGQVISDMHRIFTGDTDGKEQLNYLYKLK